MSSLNTQNPEAITFQTEELQLTILGGIRTDHLDRMRVTLKIGIINRKYDQYLNHPELANLAIRHNLDLYNEIQTEKLIRRAAEKLEVGTTTLTKAIAELTNGLEQYRLEQIEQQQQQTQQQIYQPTEQEVREAQTYLTTPNLMQRTKEDIGASGVVGEADNRLLMYLIFTSRKREHPLHIVTLGSSGSGKTYLQEKVSELIPGEDTLSVTSLSENAFYYFGQQELQHKLILIEDLDGAQSVLYPLRELQSKKRITKTVSRKDSTGKTRTISLTVEGPVSVAGCTTREKLYEDNANRSFLIHPDESQTQDEAIMAYQRKLSAGRIDQAKEKQIRTLFQNCQRILEPVTVRNPYAEQLQIPAEVFKPRRTNAHYLAFIEVVTFYHQYQREKKADPDTGEVYIETTLEDIEEANRLMKGVLLRKSDELSGASRRYFEQLKSWIKEREQATFTNAEIRTALRIALTTVKRYNLELYQSGYLTRHKPKASRTVYYEIVSLEEYEQLKKQVVTVLDQILDKLKSGANGQPKRRRKAASSPPAR